ncbi:hypothetical protein [Luteolibacter luteus]|uniref:PepSY domain-containing protein n=1 Tax=Luteolibacter luteus TaxID=2728835 RepID=A0A858RNC6_9BACT|nr:hypothetical protein [Luteolibacter luteus]QJE98014.1 hypothetical protein HHL09_20215 [Luteolibacter luteus]
MKTIATISVLALATSFASAQTQRREIRLADCPQAVQSTIQSNARGGHIDEVDFISIDGKEIYIAEVDLPRDRDLKVYVSGNGTLSKTLEDIALREAPEAVRNAVQGLGGTVDDVDKEIAGQVVTYHVEIERHGARDLDVVVSSDGTILSQTEDADD